VGERAEAARLLSGRTLSVRYEAHQQVARTVDGEPIGLRLIAPRDQHLPLLAVPLPVLNSQLVCLLVPRPKLGGRDRLEGQRPRRARLELPLRRMILRVGQGSGEGAAAKRRRDAHSWQRWVALQQPMSLRSLHAMAQFVLRRECHVLEDNTSVEGRPGTEPGRRKAGAYLPSELRPDERPSLSCLGGWDGVQTCLLDRTRGLPLGLLLGVTCSDL
jgi:hypothetical protein